MKLLFIGDIVGRPGRAAVTRLVPTLRDELGLDLVIANGENASGGKGLSPDDAKALHEAGVDFFTSGNHIWAQSAIFEYMNRPNPTVIRPANYPEENPGRGWVIRQVQSGDRVLIINLQGRVFMKEDVDCPFRTLDRILEETAEEKPDVIFVDFHAEATSEKVCLGLYAAGRISALVGTHTHVQTADETILKGHTAYLTDAGAVALKDSAIGVDPEPIIHNFLTQMPVKHTITPGGPVVFNGVLIDFDGGRATSIQRIQRLVIY